MQSPLKNERKQFPSVTSTQEPTADEALEIAVEAYIYAYPLVLMDITRRMMTNVEVPLVPSGGGGGSPINQFAHMASFPDAKFTDVVRPNVDTLYSMMWFDVTREPLVINVPDSEERYYLLQLLDLWTDVFASPGKRTTGTAAQTFAIVGPKWTGRLPQGMALLRSPTGIGWVIGRTQTNGKEDFSNVHKFQVGISAVPLSAWGKTYVPPKGNVISSISKVAPVEQVAKMDATTFFAAFTELMKENPPHSNDYPILSRLSRIGIQSGQFDLGNISPIARTALVEAIPLARKKIIENLKRAPRIVNAWGMIVPPVGTYGTAYLNRASIAYAGLGANVNEDAIYPMATVDVQGQPLDSKKKYVIHFAQEQIPPVRAFWSLTLYNDRQFLADNPIGRYAIGDRDKLKFNPDGSLTLYVQRESPGQDKESNWLPAPAADGGFSMNLRLYWPKAQALDGSWQPPAVKRVD
jgi:hypothetical protein